MPGLNSKLSVGCLIANLVGGDYGPIYQKEIERYLRNNGKVWTADRLKAIWNAALHLKNGDVDKAIALYQHTSISYHADGTPKGPLRKAVRNFVAANHPISLRRWASLLRYYTGVRVERASHGQLSKIRHSISDPGPDVPTSIRDEFIKELRRFLKKKPGPKPGTTWSNSASWESQYGQSLKGTTRYYSPYPLPKELRETYYGSFVHSLLTTHAFPASVWTQIKCLCEEMKDRLLEADSSNESIGKVFFVMEGGAKVRCVAMPNAWTQLAFRPLHSILAKLQDSFPESCVRNQQEGVYEALRQMKLGKLLYSLDLSSATDRLPRSLQQDLLIELGLPEYAEALEEVCNRTWDFPDGQKVTYSVGQPMGLYGSFPLLNITNCLIGRMACRRCGVHGDFEHQFRVVGDDIIFFNKAPADQYRSIMEALGVDISPLKSFEGCVGQFAGFVLVPSKGGMAAFRPYKHPSSTEITNVIQFLQSLGSRVMKISKKWAGIFNSFKKTRTFRALSGEPLSWWFSDDEVEPLVESIDDRWLHSVTNLCGWLDPDLYGPNLDIAYGPYANDNAEPLFHEPRATRIIGHGPNYEVNRIREQETFRVDVDLWSDPLMREELESGDIPVKKHQRMFVGSDGQIHVTKVRGHTRRRR